MARLERLLAPRSLAIVGTSPQGGRGTRVHANILKAGFGGRLYAINPKYADVLGTPCFASLSALPEVPDCVVLAVNAEATLALVDECVSIGVGGAIALASGFAEAGPRGIERQQRLSSAARQGGLAMLGPNGIGGWNVAARFAAFSPPLPGNPREGGVAVVSQSGGLLLEIANPLIERGVGLSHLLSTGNEAGTTLEEFLAHLLELAEVRIGVAIVESFKRPRALRQVLARAAELGKPLIVLKVGRSQAGSRAAASHTGALAQDDRVVASVLDQGGAISVASTEQLIETVVLFERQTPPARPETVLVSTSGGRCSLLGDLASGAGLPLAQLAAATVDRLREILPDFATPNNPLDPTGVVFDREGLYTPALVALANDPGVGMVGVFQVTRSINARDAGPQRTHRSVGLAAEVVEAARTTETPIVAFTSTTGGVVDPQVVDVLHSGGVPLLLGLESALGALAALSRFGSFRPSAPPTEWPRPTLEPIARDFNEYSAKCLLAAYGLTPPAGGVATSADDAVHIADRIGYPVAMKACDPAIAHKSDKGLVRLDIADASHVRAAFEALQSSADAVLVEAMIASGVELILGARVTEFGPVVMVGAGGTLAELVQDTQLALAPLDAAAAAELISRTRVARLLGGYRGHNAVAIDAAAGSLARLSHLICDLEDRIDEIDVNPLIVTEDGAFVADALVQRRGTKPE